MASTSPGIIGLFAGGVLALASFGPGLPAGEAPVGRPEAVPMILRPLPSALKTPPAKPPLPAPGSLAEGLRDYLPLDGDLYAFTGDWRFSEAQFSRNSLASLPNLTLAEKNQPRFLPGRFDQGVFIEYAHFLAGRNQLPPTLADAENAPEGFLPVGGAKLSQAPGLQGKFALRAKAATTGGGFATQPAAAPATNTHTFSFYAKAAKGAEFELKVTMEGKPEPLISKSASGSGDWERIWVRYPANSKALPGHVTPEEKTALLQFTVTLQQPGTLLADAFMLEANNGYGGRNGVCSWMPGGVPVEGEVLSLLPPQKSETGTVAFWASLQGAMFWRALFCIDNGVGWWPDLRLDLRNEKRLELVVKDKVPGRYELPKPLAAGEWHHYAVTWKGLDVTVFLDGKPVITAANALAPAKKMGSIVIGGVPNNMSPAARADAVFDEFAYWERTLAPEEIAVLQGRQSPLVAGASSPLLLTDLEPVQLFPRDYRSRDWPLCLSNRGTATASGLRMSYGIPGVFERQAALPDVPGGMAGEFVLPWSPAALLPGRYTMQFALITDTTKRTYSRAIEITAARVPAANAQVITWSGNTPDLAELGVTSAGLWGLRPFEVDEANRNRLYTQTQLRMTGESEDPADRFVGCDGKPGEVDQRAEKPRCELEEKARQTAAKLHYFPDIRQAILNSEHQSISTMDFRPGTMEWVKEQFGLDLTPWSNVPEKKGWAMVHPLGRLSASAGKYSPPKEGILPLTEPFYAYHRWWHSAAAGNEIFLNDTIATALREAAPWVLSIAEPVLRRPVVKAFRRQGILEDWYYYPNPRQALWVQEGLTASARGTESRITGMPQFLFKPGMAAPYGGMPPPDLFRETVWFCLSRPLYGMTYWNLGGAITREKNSMTQEEIDAKLGPTPDWKTAQAKLEVKGEWSSLFLFIPELREEFRRLHQETIHPLGALLPRWQNAPRKLAVYRSFAGQLFSEIRWPGNDPLSAVIETLPYPFDVLVDQDFEEKPELLKNYGVVAIVESPVITAPAAGQLTAFLQRGGKVISDDTLLANLPAVLRFNWRDAKEDRAAVMKAEQELLKLYGKPTHPLFIEGMEQARQKFTGTGGPSAKAAETIQAVLASGVTTATPHIYYNLLQAEDARYLAVVNDLRVPGPFYGHFGKVLETGVAQTAAFTAGPDLKGVAYELLGCRPVPLNRTADRTAFTLGLPPAGGRVLIFLPEPLKKIDLMLLAKKRELVRGGTARFSAELRMSGKKPAPGIIPVKVTVTGPGGTLADETHYGAFVRGQWTFALPLPYNAPAGEYSLALRELASGLEDKVQWKVK